MDERKDKEVQAVVNAAIAEVNRREMGDFDGLLGQFPDDASRLLRNILCVLRDELLDHHSDADARALLSKYELRAVFDWKPAVTDKVELVLQLLNLIRSTLLCDPEQFAKIVLGTGGARDKKRQDGTVDGGKESAKIRAVKAAEEHSKWIGRATSMIEAGTSIQNVASKVAKYFRKTPAAVRPVLQRAGLLPQRKTKVK